MSNKQVLPLGLYETLKTRRTLSQELPAGTEWVESEIPGEDSEHVSSLARYVAQQVATKLEQTDAHERIALVNSLLTQLEDESGPDEVLGLEKTKNAGSLVQLIELKHRQQEKPSERPATPLSSVALLTNNPKEPRLGEEIKKELESADRVDLLCSFLKLTGVNVLAPQLEVLKRRGIPFRVITTTYMGATDRKAVDKLVQEYGAEVKISYEKNSTRLHAKAWLFHRDTGFSTGYVGSSNLSHAALTDGLEWNVRISNTVTPGILGQFNAAFESYWESHRFESYTGSDKDREKLDRSLEQATIGTGASARPNLKINFSYVDVHPYPHQAIMLDELQSERQKGHHRNLAVAATGTGKTIFSALDYKRLCEEAGKKLRLLFIAHQAEILNQSQGAFATVMRDANFGEQYFGGVTPKHNDQVFATIQTLASTGAERFAPDHFDVIIVDEFHHASAPTYQKILSYFQPRELLGLTATPERTDGKNVAAEYFDGRIATQLRLWDALEADLLVPFHYYGINDATDLSGLTFERGSYRDSELSQYYLANKRRIALILQQIDEKIANPRSMRAIGFCVDREHARYMAEEFCKADIPATYLLGDDSAERRREVIAQLKDPEHELTTVFTVNLFNEGVDIPEVDTLLMLRPTQSPTLFQQQLGRGLRRSPDKAVLVVLDFVGNQAKGFRFDLKMRSLTRVGVLTASDIENPHLPPGCSIQLDKKTQEQVLRSIKEGTVRKTV
ncbi:DEAD/DEAH box helicase family protein [Rothia nasimurium]|uniref:DEAD/DEAH box helicase family protein n=1 Tax=Rothia nasimurium TaxID=85336 RepID=UPI001F20A3FA|nr:DEAD/DEAH box helicase family protein [Rothia nasimurium]